MPGSGDAGWRDAERRTIEGRDVEWRDEVLSIATDWLFSDLDGEEIPGTVILPLENPDLYERAKFDSRLEDVSAYRAVSIGRHAGQRIGVLTSKFGAPAVAMAVGVLAGLKVKSILGVGFCGGLRADIRSGDLVLPLACVRDDGTSPRYVPESYPAVADLDLLDRLREGARRLGGRCHTGVVVSTDAILCESSAFVDRWSRAHVIGVDMESGALFTVARLAGVGAASILVASDNPATRSRSDLGELGKGLRRAIELALTVASQL